MFRPERQRDFGPEVFRGTSFSGALFPLLPSGRRSLHPPNDSMDVNEQTASAAGPGPALLALYDAPLPHVYGYLLARCGRAALAEDLTAETFLAAVDAVRRQDPPDAAGRNPAGPWPRERSPPW